MKLSVLITAAFGALAFAAPKGAPRASESDQEVNIHYDKPTNFTTPDSMTALDEALGGISSITIEMYGAPWRVGQYHGQALWNEVRQRIDDACKKRTSCDRKPHRINRVEYIDNKGRLAWAYGRVAVTYNKIPKEIANKEKVILAVIDAIAYVYRAQTEIPENCMDKVVKTNDGKGTVRIYHCQVGEGVRLIATGTNGKELRLSAAVQFNTETHVKTYECGRNKEHFDKIKNYLGSNIKPAIAGGDKDFAGIDAYNAVCV